MTMKASVKVMRSYDYCHFEVCLGTDDDIDLVGVDSLRKEAARLVDKAIRQYQTAKSAACCRINLLQEKECLEEEVKKIKIKNESEWTATDKAKVKALQDNEYWEKYDYNYQDDWYDEQH